MIDYGKFVIMNHSPKKKLCWNCEGSVSLSEETCPFCGVTAVPAFLEGAGDFAPPYATHTENDFEIPKSPYGFDDDTSESKASQQSNEDLDAEPVDDFKRTVFALIFLLCGSVFFLFSMALGLFSHNGVFTLHWNANYWFIYTFLAIPLFFIGWRSLMKLDA